MKALNLVILLAVLIVALFAEGVAVAKTDPLLNTLMYPAGIGAGIDYTMSYFSENKLSLASAKDKLAKDPDNAELLFAAGQSRDVSNDEAKTYYLKAIALLKAKDVKSDLTANELAILAKSIDQTGSNVTDGIELVEARLGKYTDKRPLYNYLGESYEQLTLKTLLGVENLSDGAISSANFGSLIEVLKKIDTATLKTNIEKAKKMLAKARQNFEAQAGSANADARDFNDLGNFEISAGVTDFMFQAVDRGDDLSDEEALALVQQKFQLFSNPNILKSIELSRDRQSHVIFSALSVFSKLSKKSMDADSFSDWQKKDQKIVQDEIAYLKGIIKEKNPPAEAYDALIFYSLVSRTGNVVTLVDLARKALAIDPTMQQSCEVFVKYLWYKKEFDRALIYCKQLVEKRPQSATGRRLLIATLAQQGSIVSANTEFGKALQECPEAKTNKDFRAVVGVLAIQSDNYEDGIAVLEPLYEGGNDGFDLSYDLAVAHFLSGDSKSALPYLSAAVRQSRGLDSSKKVIDNLVQRITSQSP